MGAKMVGTLRRLSGEATGRLLSVLDHDEKLRKIGRWRYALEEAWDTALEEMSGKSVIIAGRRGGGLHNL